MAKKKLGTSGINETVVKEENVYRNNVYLQLSLIDESFADLSFTVRHSVIFEKVNLKVKEPKECNGRRVARA